MLADIAIYDDSPYHAVPDLLVELSVYEDLEVGGRHAVDDEVGGGVDLTGRKSFDTMLIRLGKKVIF